MKSAPQQRELFPRPTPMPGTAFVNDRVCFRTEGTQRVISVQGIVVAHYSIEDRAAEAYAMVMLFESGYADQNDIARCFGYSIRTLRRAAKVARQTARMHGTPIYIWKNGKVVAEKP